MITPETLVALAYAVPIICIVMLVVYMIYRLVRKTNENVRRMREVGDFIESLRDFIE